MDLLFYNYILRRFIVIELKTTDFKPEYIGQLNFYTTAINRQVKNPEDEKTIGLLICRWRRELHFTRLNPSHTGVFIPLSVR
ncbi:DUF1016 family protein [Scytonema sp. UIC 10036]|nr:DUF1016 family protein [Scytonema sp. UIC 10036]